MTVVGLISYRAKVLFRLLSRPNIRLIYRNYIETKAFIKHLDTPPVGGARVGGYGK